MSQFSAGNSNFTPTTSTTLANNYVLTALTAGIVGQVKLITWGGQGTSLVGYQTRWGRVTNTPATPTSLAITAANPNTTPLCTVNTYTTQAALAALPSGLHQVSWNVQGGGGGISMPIGGEWIVVGGALGTAFNQIACGNVSGSDANLSSYTCQWSE